jgi:DNA-binding transcriptional ArsR family regulator
VRSLIPLVQSLDGVGEKMSAFADDTRFKILVALSRSELCVCDVGAIVDASTSAVSYHLRNLFRVGAVTYRRSGKLVYYRLADERMELMIAAVLAFTGNDSRDGSIDEAGL